MFNEFPVKPESVFPRTSAYAIGLNPSAGGFGHETPSFLMFIETLNSRFRATSLAWMVLVSAALHALILGLIVLTMYVMSLLGFHISLFNPLSLQPKDLEFTLVEGPSQLPRKPTHFRAEKASRAGGQKSTLPKAQPLRAAGQKQKASPKSTPSKTPSPRPVSRPAATQPRPQPRPQPVAQPQPQPQQQQPAPAPKLVAPRLRPSASRLAQGAQQSINTSPSPMAPVVKIPKFGSSSGNTSNSAASSQDTGPIASASSGRSSHSGDSSGSGRLQPAQIPGGVSGASGGRRGGSAAGDGGHNSASQAGGGAGGGGRAGVDAMPEPDFGPYIAELQRRIKRNWVPPSDNRNKRIVAIFTIGRQGQLLGLRIQQSSGIDVADQAALEAVRNSAPFRPLPGNYRQNDIDVQFIFDYNVYTGRSNGISYH